MKHFLPAMGRLLKLRQRKMNISQDGLSIVVDEKMAKSFQRDALIAQGAKNFRGIFSESLENTSAWMTKNLNESNTGHFAAGNKAYMTTLETGTALQHTVQKLSLKAILSPRSVGTLALSSPEKEVFYATKVVQLLEGKKK